MGGILSPELIDRVREAVDITDVVSEYVPLKRVGRSFRTLCPLHEEKTPSFYVIPDKQIFYCFGCHQGGDVFTFLRVHDGMSFSESVRTIADRVGIKIEEQEYSAEGTDADELADLRRLNVAACRNYHRWLLSKPEGAAQVFLRERKISEDSVELFNLGYAPAGGRALFELARGRGISVERLVKAGLVAMSSRGEYRDLFWERLMFPITDERGRVIAFGGRTLTGAMPKYLNTSETPLFSKRRCLFGLDRARDEMRKSRHAVVVEGYTDCIMCQQMGIRNAVATLGTALTTDHVRTLRRYVHRITVVYDADEAGLKAAERALELLLPEEIDTRVAVLPEGEDPCSFLTSHGAEKFLHVLENAKELIDFKLDVVMADPDYQTVSGQARIVDGLMELIAASPNPHTRDLLIRRAALRLGANRTSLTRICSRKTRPSRPESAGGRSAALSKRIAAERELIGTLLADVDFVERALEEGVSDDWFLSRECREIAQAVFAAYDAGGSNDIRSVLSRVQSVEGQRLAVELEELETRKARRRKRFEDAVNCMRRIDCQDQAKKLRAGPSDSMCAEDWKKWQELVRKAKSESPRGDPEGDRLAS